MIAAARATATALVLLSLAACAPVAAPLDELPPAEPLPDAAGSWLELGRRLLASGQPVQAENAFIRSLQVEGMSAAALTGAGVAAQRQGLLTEAVRYFERAKEIDPGSVAAHNNLGAALYGLGDIRAAHHAFRTAFALSSGGSPEAERNLGMAELAIARAEAENADAQETPEKLRRTGSAQYKLIVAPGQG